VFGPRMASWLPVLANGGGDTGLVTEPWVARSRSREVTFEADLADPAQVASHLDRMARELGRDVVADGRRVTHVAVKVRYRSFFTPIRSMKLRGGPTTDPDVVAAAASTVLAKIDLDRPVRLLGVRVDLELPAALPAQAD
jgi:DNA polymerase-4